MRDHIHNKYGESDQLASDSGDTHSHYLPGIICRGDEMASLARSKQLEIALFWQLD